MLKFSACLGAAAMTAGEILETVNDRLTSEFIGEDGLVLDYVGPSARRYGGPPRSALRNGLVRAGDPPSLMAVLEHRIER